MRKLKPLIIMLPFMAYIACSCALIFEEDLSSNQVFILMPENGKVTQDQAQTFWWEPLEGALHYHILIVKPDFNSPDTIIIDTSITGNKFTISLLSGEYEWCVQAKNHFSTSACAIYKLTIKESKITD